MFLTASSWWSSVASYFHFSLLLYPLWPGCQCHFFFFALMLFFTFLWASSCAFALLALVVLLLGLLSFVSCWSSSLSLLTALPYVCVSWDFACCCQNFFHFLPSDVSSLLCLHQFLQHMKLMAQCHSILFSLLYVPPRTDVVLRLLQCYSHPLFLQFQFQLCDDKVIIWCNISSSHHHYILQGSPKLLANANVI